MRRKHRHILWQLVMLIMLASCASSPTPARQISTERFSGSVGIFLDNLDQSVRPQDDFYSYVNGGWIAARGAEQGSHSYGVFAQLSDRAHRDIDEILRETIERYNRRQAIEAASLRTSITTARDAEDAQVAHLFASFMNVPHLEQEGIRPLHPILQDIAAIETPSDVMSYIGRTVRSGLDVAPLRAEVKPDIGPRLEHGPDRPHYVLHLLPTRLPMGARAYHDQAFGQNAYEDRRAVEDVRAAYLVYVGRLLQLLGLDQPEARAERVLALEDQLATGMLGIRQERDMELTYNPRTFDQLARDHSNLDWVAFQDGAAANHVQTLIVSEPLYLVQLNQLLAVVPVDHWRDYFRFRQAHYFARYLSAAFQDARNAFLRDGLLGVGDDRNRYDQALSMINSFLGDGLGDAFADRHFDDTRRQYMEKMFFHIKAAFAGRIQNLPWMSEATKDKALDKLDAMTVEIGRPALREPILRVALDPQDLIGNIIKIESHKTIRAFHDIGKAVPDGRWNTNPQTVNAYYSMSQNRMVLPAAILRPPFLNMEVDDAINYGAIGAIIGHEIIHGFDDQGHKLDGRGQLRDWWAPVDAAEFAARTHQLISRYDALEVSPGLNVNGAQTLGENIADLAGVSIAYDAYAHWMAGKRDKTLLGYSGPQRFFLGWAQMWRRMENEKALRHRTLSDTHAPAPHRVNMVLSNIDAFYDAYSVQTGDALYLPPSERVRVW